MTRQLFVMTYPHFQKKESFFRKWVESSPDRKLIVLLLHPDQGLSTSSQVEGISLWDEREKTLHNLAKKLAFSKLEFDEEDEILSRLKAYISNLELPIQELKDLGKGVVENILYNTSFLKNAFVINKRALFDQKSAVICGFGPSIEKAIPFLKEIKNKALLLSSASALGFLEERGIIPDAAGLIDARVPLSYLGKEKAPVLFTSLKASHEALKRMGKNSIFLSPMEGFELEKEVYKMATGETYQLDFGFTVTDFLVSIAEALGCKQIFLVGVDLIIEEGSKYPGEKREKERAATTPKDWLLSARWLENKGKELTLIRLEPSAFALGVVSCGLDEVVERYFKDSQELYFEKALRQEMSTPFLNYNNLPLLEGIKASFFRVKEKVEKWLLLIEQHPHAEKEAPFYILESEIELEIYTELVLDPLWIRWKELLLEEGANYSLKKTLFLSSVIKKHQSIFEKGPYGKSRGDL